MKGSRLETGVPRPGQDASIWLTGWYRQTLQMQHAAVTAAASGGLIGRYRAASDAPAFEIPAEYDPFHPKDRWGELRSQLGPRLTATVIDDAGHALFSESRSSATARSA